MNPNQDKKTTPRKWRNLLLDKNVQLRLVLTMLALTAFVMSLVGYWAYLKSVEATDVALVQVDSVSCYQNKPPVVAKTTTPLDTKDKEQIEIEEIDENKDSEPSLKVRITSSEIEIEEPEAQVPPFQDSTTEEECLAVLAKTKSSIESRQKQITALLLVSGLVMLLVLCFIGLHGTHRIVGPLFRMSRDLDKIQSHNFTEPYDLRENDRLQSFFERFKRAHSTLKVMHQEDLELLQSIKKALQAQDQSSWTQEQNRVFEQLGVQLEQLRQKQ